MRRGALLLVLCVASTCASASTWSDLWSTHDQQAQHLLAQHPADAAKLFSDPRRRAYAELAAGHYPQAAELLKPFSDANSQYNRGNALARTGQLKEALGAYAAALKQAPQDADIRHNRDLVARALKGQQPPPQQQQQQQGGQSDKNSQDDKKQDPQAGKQGQSQDQNKQDSNKQDPDKQGNSKQGGQQQPQSAQNSAQNAAQNAAQNGEQQGGRQNRQDPSQAQQHSSAGAGQSSSAQQNAQQGGGSSSSSQARQAATGQNSPQSNSQSSGQDGGKNTPQSLQGKAQSAASSSQGQDARQAQADAAAGAQYLREHQDDKKGSSTPALAGDDSRHPARGDTVKPPPSEDSLAMDQWLQRIPEDSGELLRRKFRIEYNMRHSGQDDER